jgi:hypothetical protein
MLHLLFAFINTKHSALHLRPQDVFMGIKHHHVRLPFVLYSLRYNLYSFWHEN